MTTPEQAAARARMKAQMLAEIAQGARETRSYTGRDHIDARVMAAMARVPRHAFVPAGQVDSAYDNRPLPIGHGQTISQPFIVALMSDLLRAGPDARVLEVGTGSGYQTAVLSELVREVVSLEVVPALADVARERLRALGYDNVQVHQASGYAGWPAGAPYDGILVTAAAPSVPEALVEQLAAGGRMVVPVGSRHATQFLTVVEKHADGRVSHGCHMPVAFVPMVERPEAPCDPGPWDAAPPD